MRCIDPDYEPSGKSSSSEEDGKKNDEREKDEDEASGESGHDSDGLPMNKSISKDKE